MAKYRVIIEQIIVQEYTVEADSWGEAEDEAEELYTLGVGSTKKYVDDHKVVEVVEVD